MTTTRFGGTVGVDIAGNPDTIVFFCEILNCGDVQIKCGEFTETHVRRRRKNSQRSQSVRNPMKRESGTNQGDKIVVHVNGLP